MFLWEREGKGAFKDYGNPVVHLLTADGLLSAICCQLAFALRKLLLGSSAEYEN